MRNDLKLAAFCVQRRSVAAAIFIGTHLGFCDARQLPSNRQKAESGAMGFVHWIIESFDIDFAALEVLNGKDDLMRTGIYHATENSLRTRSVSIETIETEKLLSAFSVPAKAFRKDVREVITTIWPILASAKTHPAKLDAAALGLYCQTDRLLH